MKVIAIVSQKGGAGKSTLARHGAVLLEEVGLVDLDRQGTTRKWMERRDAADLPGVSLIRATADRLGGLRARAEERGYRWIVIDTPPAHDDERAVRAALEVADLAVVPVQPSPDDLEAVETTLANVRAVGVPHLFVVSRAKRSRLLEQTRDHLSQRGPLAPVEIRDLVAYPESVVSGHAVTEYAPKSPAARNMHDLWTWIAEHANTATG